MQVPLSIYIGFDPRESAAFAVARATARSHLTVPIPIHGLVLEHLRADGLYTRPTEQRIGHWKGADGKMWSAASNEPVLWDTISQWTMATEFAISRFLVPHLARQRKHNGKAGWALFVDCDVLIRGNLTRIFEQVAKSSFAICVVKHDYTPKNQYKMDGQPQTQYSRKNWSSVCFFNCDHPANDVLTPAVVNTLPGRDLHNFSWLNDEEIGELPMSCNYLVGESDGVTDPMIVHFTNGGPWMHGYHDVPFADEWRRALYSWAD